MQDWHIGLHGNLWRFADAQTVFNIAAHIPFHTRQSTWDKGRPRPLSASKSEPTQNECTYIHT